MKWVERFNEKYKGYYSNKFIWNKKVYRIKPLQYIIYNYMAFAVTIFTTYTGVVNNYNG